MSSSMACSQLLRHRRSHRAISFRKSSACRFPSRRLLGMAAIHAMGSDGVVSSPVERGAWVLRHLLNDPPPPAPPNVPQISRLKDRSSQRASDLLAHQEEAQCASCHRKIDPIGFGLENFNAAGKWRTTDSYRPTVKIGKPAKKGKKSKTWAIDASGAFHQGPGLRRLSSSCATSSPNARRGLCPWLHRTPDRVRLGPALRVHRRGPGRRHRPVGAVANSSPSAISFTRSFKAKRVPDERPTIESQS